jgi:hypothetical protein
MFVWMFNYCSLFLIVLESLPLRSLASARNVKISESCPARDRARRRTMGSITS